jgi:hypothetical protein
MNLEERDRTDLFALLALVATHGFGDGLTTGYALALHESLAFERNELIRRLLSAVMLEGLPYAIHAPSPWAVLGVGFLVGKVLLAGVVSFLLWRLREHAPRWRLWVALLVGAGIYVTVTNALLL